MEGQEGNYEKYLNKLAKRIKELRYQKGYKNYEAFAFKNDISRSQMYRYENAKDDIRFSSLVKVITALGVTFDEFFNEEFEKDEKPGK